MPARLTRVALRQVWTSDPAIRDFIGIAENHAALDVLEDEPPKRDNLLLGLENVLITPHSAALTEEAMSWMGMTAAEDIVRVLRGERAINVTNRPIKERLKPQHSS